MIAASTAAIDIQSYDLNLPFDKEMIGQARIHGRLTHFKEKTVIFREGDELSMVPILVEGRVRVFHRNDSNDRELLLYSVARKGMSKLSCLTFLSDEQKVNMYAVAESDTILLHLPISLCKVWTNTKMEWNKMVIDSFREIFDGLAEALKTAGTDNLEVRILKLLRTQSESQNSNCVRLTHEEVANYLGTTRVVVSRILKSCEKEGKLILKRGVIEIQDD